MGYKRGRGAQIHVKNRFEKNSYENWYEDYTHLGLNEHSQKPITEIIEVHPKSIVNKVTSPDIGPGYSLNPYQGCEHGCIYCYARNSHQYWGYDAGLDFETKILVKKNAPQLLDQFLKKHTSDGKTIMLSGNTDCYQPIEKKLQITRELLHVFYKHKHPVGIITKNALIQRDIDILEKLAGENLVKVVQTVTSLDNRIKNILEPRTASIQKRLETIELFTSKNIPVQVMMGPIIPAINNYEILKIAEETAKRGAYWMIFTVLRLNGQIGDVFKDWVYKNFPDRADKIINQVADCHGGKINDSRWGKRIKGDGKIAENIHQTVELARRKYYAHKPHPLMDFSKFELLKNPQLTLF